MDLSTSNDEINDLNIALERIKEFEHQVAHNDTKLDAENITNVTLLSDLLRAQNEIVFLRFPGVFMFDMLMELVKPLIHLISFPNRKF